MSESVDFILTEMEDWGRALLAEHERRVCDAHGPVIPSKNTGRSLVQYAERLRAAMERDAIDNSLHGETPWDEAVTRVLPPGYREPPEGWLTFGSLVDYDGPREFSDETDEAGMPLWERVLPPESTGMERGAGR